MPSSLVNEEHQLLLMIWEGLEMVVEEAPRQLMPLSKKSALVVSFKLSSFQR